MMTASTRTACRRSSETLREIGDVFVVAPAAEMSGASHSLTLSRPLRIRQIDERHWTVDGTPTDCVTLALHKILNEDKLPDVCVSGINHGGNLGDDATYSGTVAGALEATILGVPGSPSVWWLAITLILPKPRASLCWRCEKFSAKDYLKARS